MPSIVQLTILASLIAGHVDQLGELADLHPLEDKLLLLMQELEDIMELHFEMIG